MKIIKNWKIYEKLKYLWKIEKLRKKWQKLKFMKNCKNYENYWKLINLWKVEKFMKNWKI
jgi:hypothetical protein